MKKTIVTIFIFIITIIQCDQITSDQDYVLTPKIDYTKEYTNNNLELVIYYIPLSVLTNVPITLDRLKKGYSYKIYIQHANLFELRDKLNEINNKKLYKANIDHLPDLRVHCELISNNKILFSYSLSGNCMLFNKVKVKPYKEFYYIIKDFIPQREFDSYQIMIKDIEYATLPK